MGLGLGWVGLRDCGSFGRECGRLSVSVVGEGGRVGWGGSGGWCVCDGLVDLIIYSIRDRKSDIRQRHGRR